MNEQDMSRFLTLRTKVFEAIKYSLEEDSHCKHYEGAMAIHFPNYFEHDRKWSVSLDCYLIGPSRHYCWEGKTLSDAIENAEKDIFEWLKNST
jgi:hypothetical protein